MKEQVNFDSHKRIETFTRIVAETFSNALIAITSQSATMNIVETFLCGADELHKAYTNETLVIGMETNTSFEVGLLLKTHDITMLADFMLAGDGEGKAELDEDTKDAAKELASQLLSALNVPIEDALKKKFALRVDDIAKNMSSSLFQSSEYLVVDFNSIVSDKKFFFRFFIDGELGEYLEAGAVAPAPEIVSNMVQNMTVGGIDSSNNQQYHSTGSPNLDLLLDIDLPVSVRMGTAKLFLKDILGLGPGNIVELEQNADESIELAVNDKVIARGEVVIVDGYFGFRIKEIVSRAERIKKLKD